MRNWIFLCAVVPAVAAVGFGGCADTRQYFRPTEHVYGETMRGEAEAIYSLVGPFGPFGEAKVWSRGAFSEDGQTLLHATIDLHNTSGVAILIDPQRIRLDPVRVGRDLLHNLPPLESQVLSVAPGAFGSVRLRFVLPPRVSPGQVSSFGLSWQVDNGPQKYTQVTPFLESGWRRGYAAYPASYGFAYGYGYPCSWADPYCRGPYGYSGFGWHGGVRGGIGIGVGAPPAPPRPARTVIHTGRR